MAHSYTWERPGPVAPLLTAADAMSAARRRRWTGAAVVCSMAFHILLFIGLQQVQISPLETVLDATEVTPQFRVERATFDPAILEQDGGGGGNVTEEAAETSAAFSAEDLEKLLEEEEAGEAGGRDIVATPGVDMLENIPFEPSEMSGNAASAMESLTNEIGSATESDFSEALAAAQADLVEFSPVSPQQPVVMTGVESALDAEAAELLASLAAEASAAAPASAAAEVPDGYASLDDLIAYDGPDIGEKPIMMPTDLLFGSDEDTLRESAKASLMKLAFIVQKNPGATFTIEGHTDSFGSAEYNQGLSERRANAVRAWLVETLQLDAGRFRTIGYGKSRPIADTTGDTDAQALNRRVEIVVKQDGEEIDREVVPRAEPVTPGSS